MSLFSCCVGVGAAKKESPPIAASEVISAQPQTIKVPTPARTPSPAAATNTAPPALTKVATPKPTPTPPPTPPPAASPLKAKVAETETETTTATPKDPVLSSSKRITHAIIRTQLEKSVATATSMSNGFTQDMAASAKDLQSRWTHVYTTIRENLISDLEILFPVLDNVVAGIAKRARSEHEKDLEALESLNDDIKAVLDRIVVRGDLKMPRREDDDFKGVLLPGLRKFSVAYKFRLGGDETAFFKLLDEVNGDTQIEVVKKVTTQ
ncbi:hypothetical protein HK100_001114 [Physocladia obscura]|uniref:Uncharacterized protein n=1 Tax=Physocladia obscura TaxID=109957 RepID=A0AAD5XC23_9FUNG|nr:hypothetical protein HK100_001114 [Physocladia obscura]